MLRTVCLSLSMLLVSAPGYTQPEAGPVAHWDFDEGKGDVLHDKSGNKNDGKIRGAKWARCGSGYALEFDGEDDHVDCGNKPSLNITGPVTIEAWVFPEARPKAEPVILGKTNRSYALTFYQDLCSYWYVGSGGNKARTALPIGAWQHVAATFDGGTLRLYRNGKAVASSKSQFKTIPQGGNFFMGCTVRNRALQNPADKQIPHFEGMLDEVRVYNRALSQREILADYNRDAAGKGREPFDMGKLDKFGLELFFYPDRDKVVLAVYLRWMLPLPEGAEAVVELVRAGEQKALQSKRLGSAAPRDEDEVEFSLKGLEPGTYELRALLRKFEGLMIQAEKPTRAASGIATPDAGWLAGKLDLVGRWAEYDFTVTQGDYRLLILAARIYDSAGLRCTIDGKNPAEINLNGPNGASNGFAVARWEPISTYSLSEGRHTLRIAPVAVVAGGRTYARNVYIDAFSLAPINPSGSHEAQKVQRIRFEYPFAAPAVASPAQYRVPALPPEAAPLPYEIELAPRGGFWIKLKGERHAMDSTWSFPHGGENTLLASTATRGGEEKAWTVSTKRVSDSEYRVTAQGKTYAIERVMRLLPDRLVVHDRVTNLTDQDIGIIMHHRLDAPATAFPACALAGHPGRATRDANHNPTLFVGGEGRGIGIILLDDVAVSQSTLYRDKRAAGWRDPMFGLGPNASYTFAWDMYTLDSEDYFDFINTARADLGVNGRTAKGGICCGRKRNVISEQMVERLSLKYFTLPCMSHSADDPGISIEGIEFVNFPKEMAIYSKTMKATKAKYPNMAVMFHIAQSLYATNNPDCYADSRVIDKNGKQAVWSRNRTYLRRYFSKERLDEGWSWWIFYPTLDNSFGKAMLESVDVMMDEMGATGAYFDGFMDHYRDKYTYDRHDGYTVEIDPKTKTVKRKYGSLNLLCQDAYIAYCKKIVSKGGVFIPNRGPGTLTLLKEAPVEAYWMESLGVAQQAHLTPVPMCSGGLLPSEQPQRALSEGHVKVLDVGCLYAHYFRPPEAKNAVSYIYPLVVRSIHRGTIRGKSKIVTAKWGIYGWPGDRDLHLVHFCDARGFMAPHSFPTTGDQAGVRTELILKENETAVLKKIPVSIRSQKPVNIIVLRYDDRGIQLLLNGNGKIRIVVRHGDFPVKPGAEYLVETGEVPKVAVVTKGALSFSLPLDGPARVTIKPAPRRLRVFRGEGGEGAGFRLPGTSYGTILLPSSLGRACADGERGRQAVRALP